MLRTALLGNRTTAINSSKDDNESIKGWKEITMMIAVDLPGIHGQSGNMC